MDTLGFLKAILPEPEGQGYYAFCLPADKSIPGIHRFYPTIEDLASGLLRQDAKPDQQVYHACARYAKQNIMVDDKKRPGQQKKAWRVEENFGRSKTFYVDIDCGPDKAATLKGYATKGEALNAIDGFCGSVGLPAPMVLDSGGGIHCYWPLTKSISLRNWQAMALSFKSLLADHGVLTDPTVTADALRILRPVGCTNRKDPANPRTVKFKRDCAAMEPAEFLDVVKQAAPVSTSSESVSSAPWVLGAAPAWVGGATNALAEHDKREHFPSSAHVVADKCQQVAAMRDTQGDVSRDVWFGVINIIRHCEGADDEAAGKAIARDWTENRAATGHSDDDWEKRYDTANYGPTTCAKFMKDNPTGCVGCKYLKSDGTPEKTSPIMLGRVMPVPETEAKEVTVQVAGIAVVVEVPAKPEGFVQHEDGLYKMTVDKEGEVVPVLLSSDNFYPYHWTEDGDAYNVLMRLHQPRGPVVQWAMPMSTIGSPSDLVKHLAGKSIMPGTHPNTPKYLAAYINDSVKKLKTEVDQMKTMKEFGWREDLSGFLLGDMLYRTDGTVHQVILGGNAASKSRMFPARRGSGMGYTDAVDFVYNRAGMEPMQYAFCNAFGSILTPFSGEMLYNGVLFAITGGRSARGKTTVATAALYAFGDASQMTHNKSTTINARYGAMGVHGNLPMLFDEFTDIKPEELSAWAYSTSEGRDKGRMLATQGGVIMAETASWQLSPYVTANTDLRARLAEFRGNTQAESVRLVQVHIDEYSLPQLNEGDVSAALEKMALNSGHAGEAFVRHVAANLDAVKQDMAALMQIANAQLPGAQYRNYRAHMVCTLGAAKVLIALGLVHFDYVRLVKFAVKMMKDMCAEVERVSVVDESDSLACMINALSPSIAATNGYSESGKAIPEEVRIHGELIGRRIIGNPATDRKWHGRLYISLKAMRAWCLGNRTEPSALIEAARQSGCLISEEEKFNLGRGTQLSTAAVPCAVFDYTLIGGEAQLPALQMVPTGTV